MSHIFYEISVGLYYKIIQGPSLWLYFSGHISDSQRSIFLKNHLSHFKLIRERTDLFIKYVHAYHTWINLDQKSIGNRIELNFALKDLYISDAVV